MKIRVRRIRTFQFSCDSAYEGPEGVKKELGFGQIFTEKMGFGSLGIGIADKKKNTRS